MKKMVLSNVMLVMHNSDGALGFGGSDRMHYEQVYCTHSCALCIAHTMYRFIHHCTSPRLSQGMLYLCINIEMKRKPMTKSN
jgi:hypothetical protein